MQLIISFLSALNAMSPLGIIALLALVLFYQARNNKATVAHTETLTTLKTNDLHELPEIASGIQKLLEVVQRIEVGQATIIAKLNGVKHG